MQKKLIKGLALSLSTLLLAGCSSGASATTSSAASSANTSTEQTNQAAPEEISVMIWERGSAAPGTTQENNTLTQYIQESVLEECNVKVNFLPVPRSGSDDKINVMMAGGTAPDVIFTYERSLFGDFAMKGGLADLSTSLEAFGPTLQEELDGILEVGIIDDGQYAIPAKRTAQKTRQLAYIRKDWLDAIGMEVPTTKQELIDVLYAFKEQDPGNVGDALVPWAMGGNATSEKYYLNFVASYALSETEKDNYVYQFYTKAIQPGAEEGYKVLNTLYNDGILSKDFAVDPNDDKYKQDIVNGYAGFFLDDALSPLSGGWLDALKENVPTAEFVPLNAFENPEGEYVNIADPLHGMYIMVPKTSEKKADAVVKYLNWLADTDNAMNVAFSPEHTRDEYNIPVNIPADELEQKGYPGNKSDYSIVTAFYANHSTKEGIVAEWSQSYPTLDTEYLNTLYNEATTGLFTDPVVQEILPAETKYLPSLRKLLIEFSYRVISAPSESFEQTYATEYAKLEQSGLNDILDQRAAYYDNNIQK